MSDQKIRAVIDEIFVELFEVEPERLRPEAEIFTDLGLDSLDIVDLMVSLQQKLGVRVQEDEGVRSIRTLGDLYGYVGQLAEKLAASKIGAAAADTPGSQPGK